MRTVTNKDIISMLLVEKGTKSKRGLNYVRTVTKDYPISDEIREGNHRVRARTV